MVIHGVPGDAVSIDQVIKKQTAVQKMLAVGHISHPGFGAADPGGHGAAIAVGKLQNQVKAPFSEFEHEFSLLPETHSALDSQNFRYVGVVADQVLAATIDQIGDPGLGPKGFNPRYHRGRGHHVAQMFEFDD
ncbi:MAG: hypothetical protein V1742_04395 [Pseudomonadota bacterium]